MIYNQILTRNNCCRFLSRSNVQKIMVHFALLFSTGIGSSKSDKWLLSLWAFNIVRVVRLVSRDKCRESKRRVWTIDPSSTNWLRHCQYIFGLPCIYRYTQVYFDMLSTFYQLRSYQACILLFHFLMILKNSQDKYLKQ